MTQTETITRTEYALINGAEIAFDRTGSGHPVVLLHAGLCDRSMWDEQIAAFAEHFTVIRYDARGFGETIRPASEYFAWQDLVGLLDHLEIDQAHVVGISMGSQTAIESAVMAPDRVSALVAVAPRMGVSVSASLRAGWNEVDRILEADGIDAAVEYELRMWVDGQHRSPDAVSRSVRERVRTMNKALFLRTDTDDQEQELDPPAAERLGDITAPTFIVLGDLDVADVREAGPKLKAAIPGAKLRFIPGTAHLPTMEQPDRFNRLVIDFLMAL